MSAEPTLCGECGEMTTSIRASALFHPHRATCSHRELVPIGWLRVTIADLTGNDSVSYCPLDELEMMIKIHAPSIDFWNVDAPLERREWDKVFKLDEFKKAHGL